MKDIYKIWKLKIPQRKHKEEELLDVGLDNDLFGYDTKNTGNKS